MSIRKPEIDDREYRYLELPNKLGVALVSDPSGPQAAASMSVGVGHFQDPDELPGLAHFLEHMLFMGTESHPDENAYQQFLSRHGGRSNAYTDSEFTNYYFSILPDYLEGALELFAAFFTAPLLKEDSVDREMNAVDSEHQKNIQNDGWREFTILKKLVDSSHPYTKFGTGNLETLKKPGIRDHLLAFYRRYYSARLMKLVVIGRQPLDELETIVRSRFSDVPDHEVVIEPYPELRMIPKTVEYVPVRDHHRLCLTWAFPDSAHDYRHSPLELISHLLGHEVSGTAYDRLKKAGLIDSYIAAEVHRSTGGSLMSIDTELTGRGFNQVDQVIETILGSVELVHRSVPKYSYEELRRINELNFRYRTKSDPSDEAVDFCQHLHLYPPEDMIYAPYRLDPENDQSRLRLSEYLSHLVPEKMAVSIGGPEFESVTDSTERWYSIRYRIRENRVYTPNLEAIALPPPNPYLPPADIETNPTPATVPEYTISPTLHTLWTRVDHRFRQPRVIGSSCFHHPDLDADIRVDLAGVLLVSCLSVELRSEFYFNQLAGAEYSISIAHDRLFLHFDCYRAQYEAGLPKIIDLLLHPKIGESVFIHERKNLKRRIKNHRFDAPYTQAFDRLNRRLMTRYYAPEDQLAVIKSITLDEVLKVAELLRSATVTTTLVGDVSSDDRKFFNRLYAPVSSTSGCPALDRLNRVRGGSVEPWVEQHRSKNGDDPNSAVVYTIPLGHIKKGVTENWLAMLAGLAIVDLFMREAFFDQLRTKEQLGYIVKSGFTTLGDPMYPMYLYFLLVQSPTATPKHISSRMIDFLGKRSEAARRLTEEAFHRLVETARQNFLRPKQNLDELFEETQNEVISSDYLFHFPTTIADYLTSYRLADFRRFFADHFETQNHGRIEIEKDEKKSISPESTSDSSDSN